MTHWIVKVGAGWGKFKSVIKAEYNKDKRDFIEWFLVMAIQFAMAIFFIFYVALPIPAISNLPISKTEPPIKVLAATFEGMKPFCLHISALFGITFAMIKPSIIVKIYIHLLFSLVIKTRNYIKFIRDSKGKIST